MIERSMQAAADDHVVVITDDDEIAQVASSAGARVIVEEDRTPGDETLDTKVLRNVPVLLSMGATDFDIVLTIQPTSPLIRPETIARAVEVLSDPDVGSVLSVTDDRHLRWGIDDAGRAHPLYSERVNRQELPAELRETGGIIGARLGDIAQKGTRIVEPVSLLELTADEAVDIDSFADLYAAAHLTSRLSVAIRTDAAPELGMGHVYRSSAIAAELARHRVHLFTDESKPLGGQFFDSLPYPHETLRSDEDFLDALERMEADLVFLDVLETDAALVERIYQRVPQVKVATFEDLGTGASVADIHVAEFVSNPNVPDRKTLAGIENAILAPAFESAKLPLQFRDEVDEILILFGGTDPSELARRSLEALRRLNFGGHVTIVRGLGATPLEPFDSGLDVELVTNVRYMPEYIGRADMALTSAGRTLIELATFGVPAICLAQNLKELTHTHAVEQNGVRMLGLGSAVSDSALDIAVRQFLADTNYRRTLRNSALAAVEGRTNRRTLGRIFDQLGFDPFPHL